MVVVVCGGCSGCSLNLLRRKFVGPKAKEVTLAVACVVATCGCRRYRALAAVDS